MLGRKIVIGLLALVNLFFLFRILWSGQGVFAYVELKNRYAVLEQQIEDVEGKSLDLSKEIIRLKSDREYQEMVVRDRMKFVKKDEILYVFPENGESSGGAAANERE